MLRLLSLSIIFWSLQGFAGVKWIENPIQFPEVKANEMLVFDLSEYVEGGDYLNFNLFPGAPAWLSVGTAGILTGTPSNADVGTHSFRVMVQSGDQGDIAEANITVLKSDPAPGLNCRDGSNAYYVGATPDKKFEVFTCPR